MFDQAFIHSTHKIAYTYEARSSEVLRDSLLKKWGQSDVDPQEFKRIIRSKFHLITNIKSFDFSTLYTTIPHQKLKSRLVTIIRNSFLHKNGNRRYKYLVLGREGPYFVNNTLIRRTSTLKKTLSRCSSF